MHSSSCKFARAIISGCFTVPHAASENLISPIFAETVFIWLQFAFSNTTEALDFHR